MNDIDKARADTRTEQALADSPYQDPRQAYRERLRRLREISPSAFASAVQYYEETLLPALLDDSVDPLAAWVEYGRRLGQLTSAGRIVAVDASGRARDYDGIPDQPALILHLPEDTAVEALTLAVPREPSDAQRATLDLLVNRARSLD